MEFIHKLQKIQKDLASHHIDGWLFYDYRRSNELAHFMLEIPSDLMVSRRFLYWIPQKGEPIKIVPLIEPHTLDHLPGMLWTFKSWQELETLLHKIAKKNVSIAMEYSPNNALPNISRVDAGTIESIQRNGARVVSSANLLQSYTSILNAQQVHSHLAAAKLLDDIAEETWLWIEKALKTGKLIDEYAVQQYMLKKMEEAHCMTSHAPICAVNAHSADPHYLPSIHHSSPINKGDFILIDLWCKQRNSQTIYADITRVGVASPQASKKQKDIFAIVKKAQEKGTELVRDRYEKKIPLQGWEVDQACRDIIQEASYGEYFIHRTGHNIGEEGHGSGANLDNYETHDDRELIAGTCFSIEPGIYLPGEFGIRLEYDVYLDPKGIIQVTGGIQTELRCLNV